MQRIKLLAAMTALAMLMVVAVHLGSPYAPLVEPCMDIEDVWAIEDTRRESEEPLVTRLMWNDTPLVYEQEQGTFYCPLGLEYGQEWPQLHLTAPDAPRGTKIAFVDDYSYDLCSDAVYDGYAYQMIAYNKEAYSYLQVVFTGMMQVHIITDEEIAHGEDVSARIEMGEGQLALTADGRVHKRGGVTAGMEKCGYRIEFTKGGDGGGKISREVPKIGETKNLVLLSMALDESMMRDRLSWEIYNELVDESDPFGDRVVSYVELYINGEYRGVYVMLEPFDYAQEIARANPQNAATDSVYRSGSVRDGKGRETYQGPFIEGRGFELHYTSHPQDGAAHLQDYIDLCLTEDDEAFCTRALQQVDMQSMLRYMLLLQGCGWADNIFNNMFLWAKHVDGRIVYHFAPWDMDRSWGERPERIGEDFGMWIYFPLADRMVSLDAGGIRGQMHAMWRELRGSVLDMAFIEEKIAQYTRELNESGAAYRDAERWQTGEYEASGHRILDFASVRFELIDRAIEAIAAAPQAQFDFLEGENHAVNKSEAIVLP